MRAQDEAAEFEAYVRSRTPGLVGIWYYSCDLHGLAPGASIEWVVGVALAETGQPADLSAMPLTVAAGIPGTLYYYLHQGQDTTFYRLTAQGTPVVVAKSSVYGGDFAISPDGTRLAWSDGETGQVVVSNLDGSARKVIDTAQVGSLRWSPDSTWLVGERFVSRAERAVRLVKADGTARRDLAASGRSPTWSADGAWVVYISATQNDVYGTELTRVHPDGSERRASPVKLGTGRVFQLAGAAPGAERVVANVVCAGCDTGDPGWYWGRTIIDLTSGEGVGLTSTQGTAQVAFWTADGRMLVRVMTQQAVSGSAGWPKYALELRAKDGTPLARQAEPFDNGANLTTYVG